MSAREVHTKVIDRVAGELDRLAELRPDLTEADIVNRAISAYCLLEERLAAGHKLAFNDPEENTFQVVEVS